MSTNDTDHERVGVTVDYQPETLPQVMRILARFTSQHPDATAWAIELDGRTITISARETT